MGLEPERTGGGGRINIRDFAMMAAAERHGKFALPPGRLIAAAMPSFGSDAASDRPASALLSARSAAFSAPPPSTFSSKSTGPRAEDGKQRSRCNAVRHGLTAETVIGALEDAEDYKTFEAAITAIMMPNRQWSVNCLAAREPPLAPAPGDHYRNQICSKSRLIS